MATAAAAAIGEAGPPPGMASPRRQHRRGTSGPAATGAKRHETDVSPAGGHVVHPPAAGNQTGALSLQDGGRKTASDVAFRWHFDFEATLEDFVGVSILHCGCVAFLCSAV